MTNTPNNFKESFSGGLPREEFEKSGGNAAALTSEKLLAIPLYDHIVLGAVGSAGGKGYVSFRDRRLVDFER